MFKGAAAAEINRRVRASADDRISLAKLQARHDGGDKRSLDGSSTVTQNDGRTVQVAIVFVNYLAGTAHPDDWVNTTAVRTTSGRPVTLDQVFPDERAAYQKLAPVIRRLAKAQRQPVTESDGLDPQRANWAAWQTTRAGMIFYFQDYQLGGHGLRAYTVPWSVVRPLMSTSARKLLAPVG
ncbi:MAG: hypothetical protein ABWX96_20050 [Propionibacteriaceae bacterium]